METTIPSAFAVWLNTVFANFDFSVFKFFGDVLHAEWLTPIVSAYTHLGDSEFIIPMAVIGVILCLFKKTRKVGMTLFLAVIVGTLITNVCMKPFVLRPRPFQSLAENAEYWQWYVEAGAHEESLFRSFPSGHTTGAFEMATALFLTINNKKIKWIFPVYAVLIGCSRIYLMVHYCTDVIGGMFCGIIAGVIAFFVVKAVLKALEKTQLGDFDFAEFIKSRKQS